MCCCFQVDKIEFFAQRGSREKYGIPVINLDHISDSEYPPQRKAFEMLKVCNCVRLILCMLCYCTDFSFRINRPICPTGAI